VTNVLGLARELAKIGPVLPVSGKLPMWKDWPNKASQGVYGDPEWRTATGVGLLTGRRAGYFVLDVDGAEGAETLAAWEHEHDKLPVTWVSRTGGGGLQFFFKCPADFDVRGSARKLGPGIDIRGEGGQVVAPGSRHPSGKLYAWESSPTTAQLAVAPEWLLEKLRPPAPTPTPRVTPLREFSSSDIHRRASAYLATIAPAISGAGGHAQTLLAAEHMALGFDLSEEDSFDLLWSKYNPRCVPPWTEKEIRHKVQEASTKGTAVRRGQHLEPRGGPGAPARVTTPVTTPDAKTAEPLFLAVDDFFVTCGQKVEYILEPYLPKDGFLIVDGPPKIGKTWFLGWLAGGIAALGHTVLFVEEEGSKETLRERLQPFKRPGARIHVAHRKGFKLDDDRSLNRLIEEIKAAGAGVVILDPLNQLHHHLRKIGDVPAEVILAIARIIRETGCAVILACHDRKGQSWDKNSNEEAQSADIAGSYAWAASADNIVAIKGVPNNERRPGEVRFYVSNPDTRNGEPFPRRLAIVKPGPYQPDSMTFVTPDCKDLKALRELWPHIPTDVTEAISISDLRKESGKGQNVVQYGVTYGLRTQLLVRRVKGGGVYRVPGVVLPGSSNGQYDHTIPSYSPYKESRTSGTPVVAS